MPILHEKVSHSRLRKRNKELSILLEMSNFLSSPMSLEDILSGALSLILKYFNLKAGRIYLGDETGQYLRLAAHYGIESRGLEKLRMDEGFSGMAVQNRSFIAHHVSELEDKKRAALLLKRGLKGIICVPLINMDKVGGVMNLGSDKLIELDQNKIDLLTTIGNQIAVAIDNTRLYEKLRDNIKTLKEKKEMIKFFAYSVSHDLKSPAIGIHGLTRRLRDKYAHALDEKGRDYCDRILEISGQMVTLVENINAYIQTREIHLNFQKIAFSEITEAIGDEFSSILKKRHIDYSGPDGKRGITADRLALIRVFQNLMDNALSYAGEGLSRIKIRHEENEKYHILSFSDDGIGIHGIDRERIFNMFQRHKTSRGKAGSGLGLAIVKEIAERHKGRAWIDSDTKEGLTFCISISKDLEVAE
ncbi:MAG: ATP-binding protein [Thermodesulfobacteriota bacterium]|nr:ATP-binding protein [Thermodesulfobacteriota bacterium]